MYMPRDGKVNEMPNPKTAEEIFAEKIAELEKELAALKEKYRWRKQSEEPAPGDKVVEAVYLCEGRKCGPFYANRNGSELKHCSFWRPLDLPNLPEEEEAE